LQQLRKRDHKRINVLQRNFGSALEALGANRLRSFLTTLGIFIGVAAVIAALTLTQSASAYFTNLITSFGATSIIITPGSLTNRGVVTKQTAQNLTVSDAQTIQALPHVTYLSPVVIRGQVQVVYGGQNHNSRLEGVGSQLPTMENWNMAQGLWFSDTDNSAARAVAVLGDTVAQNLFGSSEANAVGKTIRVGNQLYRVVGVLAPIGGFTGDDVIYIPFNTAIVRFGGRVGGGAVNEIILQTDTISNLDSTVQAITLVLERSHPVPRGTPNNFQVTTAQQILQQAQQETVILTILLVGIAAISLTVGGIGIVNIMLVSVTQRTREIGIRMSLGARRSDIRNQFLIETLLLCLVGGGLGLLLGVLAGYFMTKGFGFPMVITAVTIILPFAVSSLVALVFGLYPASKAARLDPVVALHATK
jgi:putative ABC transport system permease protein